MRENPHMVPNVEDLKEQIRKLSAEQANAFGDAIYIGMTAELARECDERRRKIHDLVEILTERYEQSFQFPDAAQGSVFACRDQRLQSGNGAWMERERRHPETTEAIHRVKEEIDNPRLVR